MAARRMNADNDPPMSGKGPEWHQRYEQEQALERRRRGLPTFTRPERREAVLGRTPGESDLGTGQRATQVGYHQNQKRKK